MTLDCDFHNLGVLRRAPDPAGQSDELRYADTRVTLLARVVVEYSCIHASCSSSGIIAHRSGHIAKLIGMPHHSRHVGQGTSSARPLSPSPNLTHKQL